ncbi:uncharacterized protein SAPINGB_P005893 [Magnusiomyces paraingens]|uniref:LicD/FKTN/FKRP nucleotidyltransferase domain-containing protein n=1 Tax=Magnusiomyces paraingens TaxID=2606893 RepID=A0A5E8C4D8_9ASCO|nr:uncharacterized protein SAPINGB_P005893 [Saprochaete ingens]VVT57835.1 unnamed protein product [Saprochaete ingens]
MPFIKALLWHSYRVFRLKTIIVIFCINFFIYLLWPLGPQYTNFLEKSLRPAPLYSFDPSESLKSLKTLGSQYSFQWGDWADLSHLYDNAKSKKKNSGRFRKTPVESSPICDYEKYFGIIKKRPTFGSRTTGYFVNCNGDNYLQFHSSIPARMVLLNPSVHPQIRHHQQPEIKQVDDDTNYVFPALIDDESLYGAEESTSKRYGPEGNFTTSTTTLDKIDDYHFLPIPENRYELDPKINLAAVLNMLDQNQEEEEEEGEGEAKLKSTGFFSWLFKSSPSSSLAHLRQSLPWLPSPRIANLYRMSESELVYRVQKSIDEEASLQPLHPELTVPQTAIEERMFITQEMAEPYLDFIPSNWKMPNYKVLTSQGIQGSNSQEPKLEDLYHARLVKEEHDKAPIADKYFHEYGRGSDAFHSDFRFYHHSPTEPVKQKNMHYLFRAWSKFAQQEGIVSWLAHGTLISWYWNGISMPWDNDFDIQMSIAELDRVARKYNNTLIIDEETINSDKNIDENNNEVSTGRGVYLLDVSPHYIDRTMGNKENVIDARFIDTKTGMFIDITGIAQNNNDTTLYGCKNNHFYKKEELYPLRLTLFEGAPIYVPNEYQKILDDEYDRWKLPIFQTYMYNREINLWVNKLMCRVRRDHLQTLEDKYQSSTRTEFLDNIVKSASETPYDGHENVYCERDHIYDMFESVNHITILHQREMAFIDEVLEMDSHLAAEVKSSRKIPKRDFMSLNQEEKSQLAKLITMQPPAFKRY